MWARNKNGTRLPFLKGSVLDILFGSDEKGNPSEIPEPGEVAGNFTQGLGMLSGAAFHSNTINGYRQMRHPSYYNQQYNTPRLYRNTNQPPQVYANTNTSLGPYQHNLRGQPGGPPPTPASPRATFTPSTSLNQLRLQHELERAEMDRQRRAQRIGKAQMPPRSTRQILRSADFLGREQMGDCVHSEE